MKLRRRSSSVTPIQTQDALRDAQTLRIRRTGTGPRLVDWLPVETAGPVLVEPALQRRKTPATAQAARPWTWVESAVLAAYAGVVALGIGWHEPWADEAQAWLLARDLGWWHLLTHALHYEGSPGLWHSLLWVLVRLHVSFAGMHWVSGAIAAAGVVVLLRWSPFPVVLRVLLPFGFWLAYQDAVVARSYVLFAVLAFPAAAMLRSMALGSREARSPTRLLALAVLLGLIGNLSIHGLVASAGFALVAFVILRQKSLERKKARVRSQWIPAIVLCCFWAVAVATAMPSSDVSFSAGKNLERSTLKFRASLGSREAQAELAARKSPAADVRPGELAPAPAIRVHRTPAVALWHKVARVLALFTYPISTFRWLAAAVCLLVVVQAVQSRQEGGPLGWVGLAPWLLMIVVFTWLYLAPRHAGMLWESFVAGLWLTWPVAAPATRNSLWVRRMVLAGLLLVSLDQAWWTAHTVWSDIHGPFSGDVAVAQFLKTQGPGKRVAGFYYHTVGAAAWFHHPIYCNQPHAYWVWSRKLRIKQQAPATIATHPDILVVGEFRESPRNGNISDDWVAPDPSEDEPATIDDAYGIVPYAKAHGYRETHRFCGHSFVRDGYAEELCQVVLQPAR